MPERRPRADRPGARPGRIGGGAGQADHPRGAGRGVGPGWRRTERSPPEALQYYNGEPETGGPVVADRSQVVMRTVLEAVEWVLPALIRIFTASDKICLVEPPRPGMEEQARQATDFLNHIFTKTRIDGFLLLHDWFKDALLERLGWVKFYWDTQKTTETYTYSGQTEETYYALIGEDEGVETVKLTRHRQKADSFHLDRPQMPEPPPPPSCRLPHRNYRRPGCLLSRLLDCLLDFRLDHPGAPALCCLPGCLQDCRPDCRPGLLPASPADCLHRPAGSSPDLPRSATAAS